MASEPHAITVLVVDDEDDIRAVVRALLERNGLVVVDQALDGLDALIAVARLGPPPDPTVIVLDNMMPALSGIEVAQEILKQVPGQLIVLFSAYLTTEVVSEARDIGIAACVAKTDVADLPGVIAHLVARTTNVVLDDRTPKPSVDLREESADPSKRRQ